MQLGVTGASGYVGRALVARALQEGHAIVSLGRRPTATMAHRSADLAAPVSPTLLEGLDAVVHLAANTDGADTSPEQELAFASELAAQAATRGCRMVFLSSQAASPGAPSVYGRTKAAIEASVLGHGGTVARAGMVYGSAPGGLYGVLDRAVRRLPLLPALVWPAPQVQPIHVDDLADGLLRLACGEQKPGVLALAGPPVSFTGFLAEIARQRYGRRPRFLPIPVPALRLLLRIGKSFAGPRLSPARLDSLVALPSLDAKADLARLGLRLRNLEAGLGRPSPRRRGLLCEARRLSRALLGRPPTPALSRRYARAAAALGAPVALDLSTWLGPALLAALDRPDARRESAPGALAWRMALLLRLAETDPSLAERFLREGRRIRRGWMLATVTGAALLELRSRLLWPIARWGAPRP